MKRPTTSSGPRPPRALVLLAALAASVPVGLAPAQPAAEEPASEERPAHHLAKGSLARSEIVALGRDMVVDGEALSHAVVMSGSMRVTGRVRGDVLVVDGDAHLASTAQLEGDVFVIGGDLTTEPGCTIDGRSVAYPEASEMWTALLEGPVMGLPPTSPIVLGAKLALLAFWAFLIALLLSISGRAVLSTSESVRDQPFRNFFVGLTGVAAMVVTAVFFSSFSGALLGVPLLALVVVAALVLRFWGMVAVFHALGEWLCHAVRRVRHRESELRPVPVIAASYGLLALGALKFLPWVGVWSWSLATFIGVGAALTTKLGRRQPWFEPV